MSDPKVTYIVVLTEAERKILLKHNDFIVRDQFDSDEDHATYDSAIQRVWKAKGLVPNGVPS